eukprot:112304-Hanusia_phi.AAC.1
MRPDSDSELDHSRILTRYGTVSYDQVHHAGTLEQPARPGPRAAAAASLSHQTVRSDRIGSAARVGGGTVRQLKQT